MQRRLTSEEQARTMNSLGGDEQGEDPGRSEAAAGWPPLHARPRSIFYQEPQTLVIATAEQKHS